jgi:hypothetical protein
LRDESPSHGNAGQWGGVEDEDILIGKVGDWDSASTRGITQPSENDLATKLNQVTSHNNEGSSGHHSSPEPGMLCQKEKWKAPPMLPNPNSRAKQCPKAVAALPLLKKTPKSSRKKERQGEHQNLTTKSCITG